MYPHKRDGLANWGRTVAIYNLTIHVAEVSRHRWRGAQVWKRHHCYLASASVANTWLPVLAVAHVRQ